MIKWKQEPYLYMTLTGKFSDYFQVLLLHYPDSKIHGANMGPTWDLSAPGGPHDSPMNLAIWVSITAYSIAKSVTSSDGNTLHFVVNYLHELHQRDYALKYELWMKNTYYYLQ